MRAGAGDKPLAPLLLGEQGVGRPSSTWLAWHGTALVQAKRLVASPSTAGQAPRPAESMVPTGLRCWWARASAASAWCRSLG